MRTAISDIQQKVNLLCPIKTGCTATQLCPLQISRKSHIACIKSPAVVNRCLIEYNWQPLRNTRHLRVKWRGARRTRPEEASGLQVFSDPETIHTQKCRHPCTGAVWLQLFDNVKYLEGLVMVWMCLCRQHCTLATA